MRSHHKSPSTRRGPRDRLSCVPRSMSSGKRCSSLPRSCSAGCADGGILGRRRAVISVREYVMAYTVDFTTVSTVGLESSPAATALAGLRANEARYFKNKYDHVFTAEPACDSKQAIDSVHRIRTEERDIVI